MALCVPAWTRRCCLVVLVICCAQAADVEALQEPDTQAWITSRGDVVGSGHLKHSVIRSNLWPSLRPDSDDENHHGHYDSEHAALLLEDDKIVQEPSSGTSGGGDGSGSRGGGGRGGGGGGGGGGMSVRTSPVKNPLAIPTYADGSSEGLSAGERPAGQPAGQTVSSGASQKEMESVSTSIGVMLLGMVTFTMSLFYMAHFPDSDIQHTTWVTLSETMSLFCAVLLFTFFKDLMVLQFGEQGGHRDSAPNLWSMIVSLLRALLLFWGGQFALKSQRKNSLNLKALSSLGGNVIAFAAIDCFGMIQQVKPFRDDPGMAFLGMCIGGFLIACMCLSAWVVRQSQMKDKDGVVKEPELNWDLACADVENRFASICLGLLLSVVIRQSITGSMPPVWGSPRNKSQEQVWILFGISLSMAIPVFGISMAANILEAHRNSLPGVFRSTRITQLVLSMSMGWCLVFCGQWEFWSSSHGKGVGLGDKMTARMINALVFSYISFGFIIALDFAADKLEFARSGFQAVSNAFCLGLGLAWHGAFSEATTCLSNRFEDKIVRAYMDALMTLCLCGIVLPAWILYMLPKALAGPQPLNGEVTKKTHGEDALSEETSVVGSVEAAEEVIAEQVAEACNACGTEFEKGAQFCQDCGGKRGATAAEEIIAKPIEEQPKETKNPWAEEPSKPSSNNTPPGEAAGTTSRSGGKGSGKAAASGGKGRGGGKAGANSANTEAGQQDDAWGGGTAEPVVNDQAF